MVPASAFSSLAPRSLSDTLFLRFLLGLAILAFLPLSSMGEEWQETKSQIANFSIQFPGASEYIRNEIDTDYGELVLHQFVVEAENGNTAYIVVCMEYPEALAEDKTPEKILQDGKKGAVGDATLLSEKEIVGDGYSGLDLSMSKETPDHTEHKRWQLILFNNNLYQIGYVRFGQEPDEEIFKRITESFQLLRK